jgi:hypothetical protein
MWRSEQNRFKAILNDVEQIFGVGDGIAFAKKAL